MRWNIANNGRLTRAQLIPFENLGVTVQNLRAAVLGGRPHDALAELDDLVRLCEEMRPSITDLAETNAGPVQPRLEIER